jgi:hypothetical protein
MCSIALLALLSIVGCAGIEPYEPVNHREEGPPGGVFSGASGGFTIYGGGEAYEREEKPAKKDMKPQ